MSSNKQHVELVEVTPDLAHDWLGYNTHNRKMRQRTIESYAGDMVRGDWQWNGESIKFATDGTLLDGQHRLAAVIAADVTVPMLVVRGLPNNAQDTVDGGIKRSFADVLNLRGEKHYTTLAAVTRRVAMWEAGVRKHSNSQGVSNAVLLQALVKYPHLRDVAPHAEQVSRGCGLTSAIVGLAMWLFYDIDASDADFFFDRLRDGQNLAKGDPIYELRRTLDESRTSRGTRSQTFLLAITIKAWNAYRDGAKVGLLRYRPGGANPERFPEPR